MMYGMINTKTEKERDLLRDALKEVYDICQTNMPKSKFNHYERIIVQIHGVSKNALDEIDKVKRPTGPR